MPTADPDTIFPELDASTKQGHEQQCSLFLDILLQLSIWKTGALASRAMACDQTSVAWNANRSSLQAQQQVSKMTLFTWPLGYAIVHMAALNTVIRHSPGLDQRLVSAAPSDTGLVYLRNPLSSVTQAFPGLMGLVSVFEWITSGDSTASSQMVRISRLPSTCLKV